MRLALGADLLDGPSCGMRIALEGLIGGMRECGLKEAINLIHTRSFDNDEYSAYSDTIIPRGSFPGAGLYWSQRQVPHAIRTVKANLLHWPYQIMPPMKASVPRVISVWDLAPMNYSDPSWSRLAVFVKYRTVLFQALKSADRIITHCRAMADELVERFELSSSKIEVIYPGLSERFEQEVTRAGGANPDGPILYVGTNSERKNLDLLIRSYGLLVKQGIKNRLALRVAQSNEQKTDMQAKLAQAGVPEESVLWLEQCDISDLIMHYRSSALFAFPSLYEGFGLPLIEASACGLPVVALNRSAMPEVMGTTGILVETPTAESFARGMLEALVLSREGSVDIGRQAKEQAAKFNWTRAARETISVYESLCPGIYLNPPTTVVEQRVISDERSGGWE